MNTNRLIFISNAKFYGAWAWHEWSVSYVEYLMTSLLSQDLHVADQVVICTLTQTESLTTVVIGRGSLWASLGPGQPFFKSKDEFTLASLDCFSLTLSLTLRRGRRQAAFQPAQLKSKAPGLIYWNHEGSFNWLQWAVQQDFGKPGAVCSWWPHTIPCFSLLGYPEVTHFVL